MNPTELILNIHKLIKSIPKDKYDEFIIELTHKMGLHEDVQITLVRKFIDDIRNS